jgi:hypothetical protein
MRNLTGGVYLAILAASFAGGYGSRGCADASRRDSLRVALTQLEDATERSEIQDTLLAGMAWTQARTADSLEFALRRTNIRVVRLVDTLKTFVLPAGTRELLDSLAGEVAKSQSLADSLWVTHNEEIRLYELRIVAKDSLIREWRTLAQAAVKTPSQPHRLRTLALGVLVGAAVVLVVK